MLSWKKAKPSTTTLDPPTPQDGYPVYINVYDLSPMNKYLYHIGLGIFHTGVQIHDIEYSFGGHPYNFSGIFHNPPKQGPPYPNIQFRKSIQIGKCHLTPEEIRKLMEEFGQVYKGTSYRLLTNNCNHFTREVCKVLTEKEIPRWVNRLAGIAVSCPCVSATEEDLFQESFQAPLPETSNRI